MSFFFDPLSLFRPAPVQTESAEEPSPNAPSSSVSAHQPPRIPDVLSSAENNRPSFLDFRPSKPTLASQPQVRAARTSQPELDAIRVMDRLYRAGERNLVVHSEGFGALERELDDLHVKNLETLKERCDRTQSHTVWEGLRKIGSAVLAVVSTFLGFTLFSAGVSTLIGGALIASGIMTLANLAFTDAGLWEWVAEKMAADNEEKQRQIANMIPLDIGVTASGIGLASLGAFAAWGALPAVPKALSIAQTASNLATAITTVGSQFSQARIASSQASVTELQGKLALHYHRVEEVSEHMQQLLEQQTHANRSAKQLLNLTIQTKQALLA